MIPEGGKNTVNIHFGADQNLCCNSKNILDHKVKTYSYYIFAVEFRDQCQDLPKADILKACPILRQLKLATRASRIT